MTMMNERMQNAINGQIKWELYSAYLYLSMSVWYMSSGLKGFAQWERVQAQEELAHALKFLDYVTARGGRVELQAVEAPPKDWKSPRDAFEFSLAHEKKVTGMIHDLVNLAIAEKDHATYNMLQWYVNEQVEEEENATEIVEKLRMIEDERGKGMLYMLDKELGSRVYTPPAQVKE